MTATITTQREFLHLTPTAYVILDAGAGAVELTFGDDTAELATVTASLSEVERLIALLTVKDVQARYGIDARGDELTIDGDSDSAGYLYLSVRDGLVALAVGADNADDPTETEEIEPVALAADTVRELVEQLALKVAQSR